MVDIADLKSAAFGRGGSSPSTPTRVLVVARYKEDISWLKEVDPSVYIFVYDKDILGDKEDLHIYSRQLLPNIGNEAHTYINHIVKNYNDAADMTFFVQGNPFDHSPDALKYINGEIIIDSDYTTICNWVTTSNQEGAPHTSGLPVGKYYEDIFSEIMQDDVYFGAGAQFVVTKKAIASKPLEFWEKLLELSKNTNEAPFVFERLWHKFFEC